MHARLKVHTRIVSVHVHVCVVHGDMTDCACASLAGKQWGYIIVAYTSYKQKEALAPIGL